MRRTRIVGLCLLAAFAAGAMASASASATLEFGQCKALKAGTTPAIKHGVYATGTCTKLFEENKKPVAKGNYEWYPGPAQTCYALQKGEYNDAGCTQKSSPKKTGHYEKQQCVGKCNGVTTASLTEPYLESEPTPGKPEKIECKAVSGINTEIISPTQIVGIARYTGCTTKVSAGSCQNTATEGELLSSEIIGEPEEKAGKVWINYSSRKPGPAKNGKEYLINFECAKIVKLRAEGHSAGVVKGGINLMSKSFTNEFARSIEGIAGQALTQESNTGTGWEAPEPGWQYQVTSETYGATLGAEIRKK
jgi:hypothetical protein